MAITGIVMMAYADNFHADSIIGVAFAVGSASTSALYKVFRVLLYVLIIICTFFCEVSIEISFPFGEGCCLSSYYLIIKIIYS